MMNLPRTGREQIPTSTPTPGKLPSGRKETRARTTAVRWMAVIGYSVNRYYLQQGICFIEITKVKGMAANRGNREARKAELLRISREVFAEKGFEATTISEIVARAGVAQGT
ncbi:TetR/AcrR family transcriptional regulator, partial [Thermogemmatispora sp.]|uniref:TetR/AcrR family transcriptional regulator n=1 Tax=Thermogemmatispora sp. TaxID=1968838 RepID=UPI0035E41B03